SPDGHGRPGRWQRGRLTAAGEHRHRRGRSQRAHPGAHPPARRPDERGARCGGDMNTPLAPDDLRCELEHRGFTSVLHVAGTLTVGTTPHLRTAFLKCLADEPDLIVIDLASLQHEGDTALTVFPALAQHAATWPGRP